MANSVKRFDGYPEDKPKDKPKKKKVPTPTPTPTPGRGGGTRVGNLSSTMGAHQSWSTQGGLGGGGGMNWGKVEK
jgi:hypothetical protein